MSSSVRHVLETRFLSSSTPGRVAERLASLCTLETVDPGTCLFREGERHDQFAIVAEGQIDLEMHVPGRGDTRILSLGPGDLVGWSPLVGSGRMTATAIVTSKSQLLSANGLDVRAACEVDREFGFYVMEHLATALARRLVATRLQLLDLFAGQPLQAAPRSIPEQAAATGGADVSNF